MAGYKVSPTALREVAEILSTLHTDRSPSVADRVEGILFGAFDDLGNFPGLGHSREDITSKKVLFYTARPYVVVFRRIRQNAQILRVVHGSRDISKLL